MEISTPRFRAIAVSAGLSLWFFIISSGTGFFNLELFLAFVISISILTQIFSTKISRYLEVFGIINTKIFLGIFFIFVLSVYGVLFKLLRIDLLRKKKQNLSYWLERDEIKPERIFKQY